MLTDVQISMVLSSVAAGEPLCCDNPDAKSRRATVATCRAEDARIADECYERAGCMWKGGNEWEDLMLEDYVDKLALGLTL